MGAVAQFKPGPFDVKNLILTGLQNKHYTMNLAGPGYS